MSDDGTSGRAPMFSVLIGLVSTEDRGRILETLQALRMQSGGHTYEIILGDRRNDEVSAFIADQYPEATLLALPAGTSLPMLRTAALAHASGRYVAVTEDHCIPTSDWLDGMARAFARAPSGTVAVGGCVENGVTERVLDWATFYCEYGSYLAPVAEGACAELPGMNIAYDREALAGVDRIRLSSGFWETTVHPVLQASGGRFYSTNDITLLHAKRFTLSHFLRQRYLYSRYYAALRFSDSTAWRRAFAFLATPLLPAVLLGRLIRNILAKRRMYSRLVLSLPLLALFTLVWAIGEMAGYALGPGDALLRVE